MRPDVKVIGPLPGADDASSVSVSNDLSGRAPRAIASNDMLAILLPGHWRLGASAKHIFSVAPRTAAGRKFHSIEDEVALQKQEGMSVQRDMRVPCSAISAPS